ncbi:A-kinase anchor protein 13 isoform X1 [Thunnus albacares]|uniref:A-kinase anchor protein 13 isoform X1 n=1 Tax=Thunnus albacares TaxID=8236 RepID=UPI001CF68CE6|nr:A-kinase anchor protein 13 isoform X1 [Thunnus albacares]
MKLSPQQAPLYGECVLTVQLDDDDVGEEQEEEVEFYLLFLGSTQRHLASTLRVSHVTLQAVCPAHNVCEQVLVTLCLARPGGPVDTHSQEIFCFVQDLALDMAHFLLNNTAPQEALLLDDEQIPLKECERLDQSLALALKHLTLCHQRTSPGLHTHSRDALINTLTLTDMDRHIDSRAVTHTRTQTDTATDTHTHTGTDRHSTEAWLDSCSAQSQCQQHSSLLHLAAGHGLRTVASFLLQQPGGRDALRRTNAQGQTPACLAKTRGHQQLLELFTQYETSSDIQVEPKDQLHFYPGGRVFQHHSNLGTYTLTFSSLKQREGDAGTESSGGCRLQDEVAELRRLIQLHRDKKGISDLGGTITLKHASTSLSINHEQFSPDWELQPRSNSQQESEEGAGLAVVTIENCSTITEEQGSPSSLEKRRLGGDSAVVTQTPCTTGTLCQSQETGGEQKGTPTAISHAGRSRKNKRRTTKTTRCATESPGNNRGTPEAGKGTAQRQPKTTGSVTEETQSPIEPVVGSVIGEARATKNLCSPGTEETQLPINPSGPGGDENCTDRKAVALPTTTVVEKQEGQKWEVELLISDRVIETETLTETEQGDTDNLLVNETNPHSALEPAAGRKVTMGQEQSQDPQESQPDPGDPSQPDSTHKSPQPGRRTSPRSLDTQRKPHRVLWRDGGQTGSRMESPPHRPEMVANTVWYQDDSDQGANEDSNIKAVNSLSVWYDADTVDQRKTEQLEQGTREQKECDLSSAQASGLSAPQLLEQGLSSRQLSAALSQPHAVGTQPVLSHGPGAQRREVHGSQQEEEVAAEWKERGREKVSNRETTYIRKSSETVELEEGGEEKPESEEIGAKGRKKRRKKRGKRGGTEAKLSSSSSIESQSQIEVQAQREQVTNLNTQSDTASEAKDITGRADVQSPRTPEPTRREEADKDAMHLPSQTEGQTRGTHGPDCVTNSESSYTTSGFSSTELEQTELTDGPASRELSEEDSANLLGPDDLNPDSRVTASELNEMDRKTEIVETVYPMRTELLDPAEIKLKGLTSPDQQTMDNVESKALSAENEDFTVAGKAVASVNWTGLVKSNCPEELPVKHSDPTEFTEDSFLVEFPEQNTQHVQSVDSNKAVQPVDPNGKPTECMESEQPTEAVGQTHLVGARSLPFEGTADVSPLQIREGSAETTMREYLEHCFASEMLRDQQHKKEKKKELWVDDEEVGKERKRNDNEMVHGTELFSIHEGKKVEGEEFPSIDREKEQQKYNEDLVATAVAVVTVAIASALASIEVNQQLADNQSEIKESASKAAANDPPLPLDANAPTDNDNTFNIIQSTQMTAQLINKDKDNCQLLADSHTAETVSQHLLIKPTVSSEEQANTRLPTDSHSVELQSQTETEHPQTPQLVSNEHANPDLSTLAETSSLPQLDKQEIQTETKKNKFLTCSLSDLPKEDSLLEVNIKSLPEANEMIITEVDSRGHMLTGIQLQQKSQLPCPVIDTGQHPEASAISCLDSEENPKLGEHSEPQDQSLCRKESEIQAESELESHFQKNEGHDKNDSYPIASVTAENEVGGQVQRDSSDKSKAGHSESERCENSFTDMQAKKCKSIQHLDGQVHTPYEREIPTLPLSTLPVTPRDSAPVADSSSEELTPPVNLETGKFQSSHSLLDMKLDAGSGSFQCKDHKSGAMDNKDSMFKDLDKDSDTLDTVDGWKERERNNMKRDEETKKEMVTAADTSQTETFPAAKEEPQQTRNDSDSIHTLHIQRERDVFYPVHPCPEPSTVTACSAVCPDREECVSVCLLQSNSESLKVSADLDDNVFKKPVDPAPRVGDRGRGIRVSWSSTNDASTQGAFSPSEGVSSVDTSDTMAPCSSRHSWKSETEERGGGETEGGGEEEEKKDKLPENPVSSAILRASIRSLSPYRRHSWEPGRNATADMDVAQRSSLKSLSGEVKRAKPPLHRRSMSWCPSNLLHPDQEQIDNRSYSLEGLVVESEAVQAACPSLSDQEERTSGRSLRLDGQHRGSLVSLTEEEQEGDGIRIDNQTSRQVLSMATHCPAMFHHQTLTKSISMVAISHQDVDVTGFPRSKRRISFSLSISPLLPKNRHFFSIGSEEEEGGGRASSFSSNSGSLEYSISEEEPGPLRSETEGKGGAKISRTFSYLRSKMSKKGKEKEKERRGEKERESKEREKKTANGHLFIPVSPSPSTACQHCIKSLHNKDAFLCNNCGVNVHKSCRESLAVCTKSKTKQQSLVPEAVPGSAVNMRSKSTSSASSFSSTSSSSSRERWSTVTTPDDQLPVVFSRRHPSIFNSHSNLAKSISTSNIAGLDDVPLKGLKSLSQSTDSLHQGSKVNASTESLTDEGTEMMDSQLMGEFECDIKDLEADSWSGTVDKKFLKTLKKDEIKRQDVIYEMYQTEFHHVRTLKIMSEVYYKGIQKELQLDTHTLDKIFPVLDDLLHTHTRFLTLLLEQKRASSAEGQNNNSFLICSIGEVLVNQFSGCSADRMKKVYGKFCSRHNEAVNLYKDLHAKDKRFQAFIKRIMSSSIVRRLSIPECILLVTQRITKYPVLIQRILQHTKDTDEDHSCVSEALRCVKELITAVDSKVNEQEKKRRLREVYSRTDSKSIMRMKSGQMFAKEDLIRGRKLLHDGALQLKNSAGRLKDVHAMLLSDVLVFLQEKDQKYVFASLDQRSTVISLQNLIVREVANEERGLFLITAGIERPEMVEVLASSKEERITWRAIIQDAMHCMEKDEDEGVPSETEEDRRQQENRAKEIRELLRRKDEQIISLLEEKVHIFRDLGDCNPVPDDINPQVRERMLFRATPDDVTKGEPIIKDALREVETLHALLNSGVGGAGCSVPVGLTGGSVGSVCLPRRAETFGGFDSHQMNSSKNGEKEEGDESLDLRRTESDSVLKKGATASLQMLVKRNNEQVQHSVTHLHDLLISLQAVVLQQDSFIEDQRQAMNERLTTNSSRHSSSSSLSSSSSSRPSSLIEQEKHRSLERQRQEAASLQKQQAAHQEEKKRREKEWELKEKSLAEREERLQEEEEETGRRRQELAEEKETLQRKKDEYQRDLERLKEAQRRLERDKEALRRDTERLEAMRRNESEQFPRYQRTPSTTSEDSIRFQSSGSLDLDSKEAAEQSKEVELSSSAPVKEPFLRIGSKKMGKNFNPFSSSSSSSSKTQGAEKESQLPTRLLQLAKPKEKKDKKKKKGKGGEQTQTESKVKVMSDPQNDGDIFFC